VEEVGVGVFGGWRVIGLEGGCVEEVGVGVFGSLGVGELLGWREDVWKRLEENGVRSIGR